VSTYYSFKVKRTVFIGRLNARNEALPHNLISGIELILEQVTAFSCETSHAAKSMSGLDVDSGKNATKESDSVRDRGLHSRLPDLRLMHFNYDQS
jgi:hypothetical protein